MNIEQLVNNVIKAAQADTRAYEWEDTPSAREAVDGKLEEARVALLAAVTPSQTESTEKIHHPRHYNAHPSGVEAVDLCEHLGFNVGNAVKYLFRCGHKPGEAKDDDLKKARFYLARAVTKRKRLYNHKGEAAIEATVERIIRADPASLLANVLYAWQLHRQNEKRTRTAVPIVSMAIARRMLADFDEALDPDPFL